ncbi:hypothetical protein KIM372_08980 [Bombiscardovia nodaiensis]|uniref:ABC3 transporter permease C-terminal domain-containing protein n=1 Tax=Bombiscardovia nodaiensis TaxID=2932181 RepID=A0ABN6S9Y4_9BIFI|nr:hypothetical protein KIM372_08980 [Bombiscardovia nodaiensis]
MVVLLLPLASNIYLAGSHLKTMSREQIMGVLSTTGSGPLLGIILILVALARSGGTIIGWVTRLWTGLVPSSASAWKIARSQAIARSRGKAFGSTIISLTACLFFLGGLLTAGQTSSAAMRAVPQLEKVSSGGPLEILSGFGAALLIALIGAVASFAISAQERKLDLALLDVAGAGPEQLSSISALDGVILMTTGILVAAGSTLIVGAATAVAYWPLSKTLPLVFPWQLFLELGLPIIMIGASATLLTARSASREPAIATIQSAIGE